MVGQLVGPINNFYQSPEFSSEELEETASSPSPIPHQGTEIGTSIRSKASQAARTRQLALWLA